MPLVNKCYFGDCRDSMRQLLVEGVKVQTCVTSPPYWGLRDYGVEGQLGLEKTPEEYVAAMVEVFSLVFQMLHDDGTLWLDLGDSYASRGRGKTANGCADPKNPKTQGMKLPVNRPSNQSSSTLSGGTDTQYNALRVSDNCSFPGLKPKDMVGIPWRVAFALQADGWYLRSDIIWSKPNPMPESVTDRPTRAHEYIFLLSKSPRYYYDAVAIRDPAVTAENRPHGIVRDREYDYDSKQKTMRGDKQRGHSRRYAGAHFATFPPKLIEPCILAGSRVSDIVFDPFFGSGTTGEVAQRLGRKWVGCELNEAYSPMQKNRTQQTAFSLFPSEIPSGMPSSVANPSMDT